MKKRIFAMLLALTMLLSTVVVVGVSAEDPVKTEDTATVATVNGTPTTWGDLKTLMAANDGADATIVLTADIVVSEWTSVPLFKGTLDGDGHSITGTTAPLFTKLDGATVKNLTVTGTVEGDTTGMENKNTVYLYAGMLAAQAVNTVTLEFVTTNGSVTVNVVDGRCRIGGMLGSAAALVLKNCVNNCSVSTSENGGNASRETLAGGYVGYVTGKIEATDCVNNGDITTKNASTSLVGGFVAQQTGGGSLTISFTRCANFGDVTLIGDNGGCKAGGILSNANQWNNKYYFTNCYNAGNISAFAHAGGITSDVRGYSEMVNCVNAGNITATNAGDSGNAYAAGLAAQHYLSNTKNVPDLSVFKNCINYGTVTAARGATDSGTTVAGGIIGHMHLDVAVFENNINKGTVTSGVNAGGLMGLVNIGTGSNAGTIQNCLVDAAVTGGEKKTGAFIGANTKGGEIKFDASYYVNTIVAAAGNNGGNCTYSLHNYADTPETLEAAAGKSADDLKALSPVSDLFVQESVVDGGKFNVRFLTGVDTLAYSKIGFQLMRVELNGTPSNTVTKDSTTVYTAVKGYNAETGVEETYEAADFDGSSYVSALTVNGVPADVTVTFIVRPYVVSVDGETTVYGNVASFTYVNGVLQIA